MAATTLIAPHRAEMLRTSALLLAFAAGVIASALILLIEPIADFLGEGAIRATGLEGGARRGAIAATMLVTTAVMVAACWRSPSAVGYGLTVVAALVALGAAGPFALPAIVLTAGALLASASGVVERGRLAEYAPGRHPLRWAVGSIVGAGFVVIAAYVTWFLVSPLLDEGAELDESLAFTVSQPTIAATGAATPTGASPAAGEATPPAGVATPSSGSAGEAADGTLIGSGELMGTDSFHFGSGRVLLVQGPDGRGVLRFEDYEVRNGPDINVFLTPDASGDVHVDGALDLGEVRATRGSVNYALPLDTDLSSFRSAVIYCVSFRVVFAVATFE